MAISNLWAHFRQNYFMPDRLTEYRQLLGGILERGYGFMPLAEFANAVREGATPGERTAVLRVDVDSDPKGARRMFEVERALGIRATYYFRLSTIDREVIAELERNGTEVGYHFEEASALARRRGFRQSSEVQTAREELRQQFRRNFAWFRALSGVAPRTVVAHGDFLNRKLGVSNNCFVDRALLDELGIVAEAYEPWLLRQISARLADRPPPQNWHPRSPEQVLALLPSVLALVLHPRQWVRSPAVNARADLERVFAEAEYRFRLLTRRLG